MLRRVEEDPAVRVVFTGRSSVTGAETNLSLLVGEGDVLSARTDALRAVGAGLSSAVFMEQVHGGGVARVTRAEAGRGAHDHADAVPGVDALVTTDEDVALVVMVADCVPVILVNPEVGVAAVHAGRGGVTAGVVPAAVDALAPGDAARVVAVIGPAIGGCCYEVPEDMAAAVAAEHPAAKATTTWGTPALDLPAAVEAQLHQLGVARVERAGGCTRCSSDDWYSHRATTAGKRRAGRQAGIVMRAGAGTRVDGQERV